MASLPALAVLVLEGLHKVWRKPGSSNELQASEPRLALNGTTLIWNWYAALVSCSAASSYSKTAHTFRREAKRPALGSAGMENEK